LSLQNQKTKEKEKMKKIMLFMCVCLFVVSAKLVNAVNYEPFKFSYPSKPTIEKQNYFEPYFDRDEGERSLLKKMIKFSYLLSDELPKYKSKLVDTSVQHSTKYMIGYRYRAFCVFHNDAIQYGNPSVSLIKIENKEKVCIWNSSTHYDCSYKITKHSNGNEIVELYDKNYKQGKEPALSFRMAKSYVMEDGKQYWFLLAFIKNWERNGEKSTLLMPVKPIKEPKIEEKVIYKRTKDILESYNEYTGKLMQK
jgi:hypothetical protein